MCAILLLAAVIVVVIVAFVVFVQTAMILLPWSLSAGALAVLLGLLLGKLLSRSAVPQIAMPAGLFATAVLTLTIGYLGCSLIPPQVPPAPQRTGDLRDAFEMPPPSQEKLNEHIPTHLTIAAMLSATALAVLWPVVVSHRGDETAVTFPDI